MVKIDISNNIDITVVHNHVYRYILICVYVCMCIGICVNVCAYIVNVITWCFMHCVHVLCNRDQTRLHDALGSNLCMSYEIGIKQGWEQWQLTRTMGINWPEQWRITGPLSYESQHNNEGINIMSTNNGYYQYIYNCYGYQQCTLQVHIELLGVPTVHMTSTYTIVTSTNNAYYNTGFWLV
jgi:hypothetical protein